MTTFQIQGSEKGRFKCMQEGKVRHIENGKTKEYGSAYCINHFEYEILNYQCVLNKNCEAYNAYYSANQLPRTQGERGNPYHRKCYVIGGQPKLIEYFDGEDWKEGGICVFSDESFISVYNKL